MPNYATNTTNVYVCYLRPWYWRWVAEIGAGSPKLKRVIGEGRGLTRLHAKALANRALRSVHA